MVSPTITPPFDAEQQLTQLASIVSKNGMAKKFLQLDPEHASKVPSLQELLYRKLDGLNFEEAQKVLRHAPSTAEYFLIPENNFPVYFQNQKQKNITEKTFSIQMLVRVGNLRENRPEEIQFAHLLEHAAFLGLKSYLREQIQELLVSWGTNLGVHANAFVNNQMTVFKLNKIKQDDLFQVLYFFYEISCKQAFNKELIEKEIDVIITESNQRDNIGRRKLKWLYHHTVPSELCASYFPGPFEVNNRENITEKLKIFYEKHYHAGNMALILCGDFGDPDLAQWIKAKICDIFGEVPKGEKKAPITSKTVYHQTHQLFPFEDPQSKKTSLEIWRCLEKVMRPKLGNNFNNAREKNFEYETLLLQENIFNTIFRNRFLDEMQKSDPCLSEPLSGHFSHFQALYKYFFIQVQNKKPVEAFELVLTELKKTIVFGVSENEFNAIKTKLITRYQEAFPSLSDPNPSKLADGFQGDFENDVVSISREVDYLGQLILIAKMSHKDLSKYIANYWNIFDTNQKPYLFSSLLQSHSIDSKILSQLNETFQKVSTSPVQKPEETRFDSDWVAPLLPPAPYKKGEEKTYSQGDFNLTIQELSFDHTKVFLVPNHKDSNPSVYFSFLVPDFINLQSKLMKKALYIALETFKGFDINDRSNREVIQSLYVHGLSRFDVDSSTNLFHISLVASNEESAEIALRAFFSKLASINEMNEEKFKEMATSFLENHKNFLDDDLKTPDGQFLYETQKLLYSEHELLKRLHAEELIIDPKDFLKQLRSGIADTTNASFIICGKFNTEKMSELVAKTIGHFKGNGQDEKKIKPAPYKFPSVSQKKELYIGNVKGRSTTEFYFPMTVANTSKDFNLRWIISRILSQYLSAKLREKGLLYTIGASFEDTNTMTEGDKLLKINFTSLQKNHSACQEYVLQLLKEFATDSSLESIISTLRMENTKRINASGKETNYQWRKIKETFGLGQEVDFCFSEAKLLESFTIENIKHIINEVSNMEGKPYITVTLHPQES